LILLAMAKTKQANCDGSIVDGEDPEHPSPEQRDSYLKEALISHDWSLDSFNKIDLGGRYSKVSAKVSRGNKAYHLEIYVFLNLAWSSGGRSLHEKRIQLSREYQEHSNDFRLDNTKSHKCLLLGIYRRDNKTVFCAWPTSSYLNHNKPSSCYVSIEAIADAMRIGFGQYKDQKGMLVCCFQPSFIHFYIENIAQLHNRVVVSEVTCSVLPQEEGELAADERIIQNVEPIYAVKSEENLENLANVAINPAPDLPRNWIIYGAPGTGKSYKINECLNSHFSNDKQLHERVTFHPDYGYSQFVGSYRPVPVYRPINDDLLQADKTESAGRLEPLIDYRYVPGPFLRMLCRALKNREHSFVLIIEELNRANAPAVFGDAFQMLDRDTNGEGIYGIHLPTDATTYIRSQGIDSGKLKLPPNLFLWATMNSSDQGVLPLDSAFKRRWSFEYMPLNENDKYTTDWTLKFQGRSISWNRFRDTINNRLAEREIPEDRHLGPFFMRKEELDNDKAFKNKILLYLRDDVVRHEPQILFNGNLTFGAIVDAYDQDIPIFDSKLSFD